MEQLLMHKNTEVALINVVRGSINDVSVLNKDLFPYAGDSELNSMRRWLISRQSVTNRKDIMPFARFYGSETFASKSLVSLSDCYWIKDKKEDTKWEDISPYKINDFSKDDIFMMVQKPNIIKKGEADSPNLTIPGTDPLYWYTNEKNERGLINFNAQKDMNIWKDAKKYNSKIIKPRIYTIIASHICTFVKTVTSEDVERVPFGQLYLSTQKRELSKEENLKRCCEHYKIPNWQEFINGIIEINHASEHADIDLLDVFVLRKTDTLQYIGFDLI